jgi:trypsin
VTGGTAGATQPARRRDRAGVRTRIRRLAVAAALSLLLAGTLALGTGAPGLPGPPALAARSSASGELGHAKKPGRDEQGDRKSAGSVHGARHRAARAVSAIVGGSQIPIAQAPWQVWIVTEMAACGGSIIDLSHVLTAAHCTVDPETGEPVPAESFQVFAGVSNTKEAVEGTAVSRVRAHPYWNGLGPDADDVAVLELAEALPASASIQPVAPAAAGAGPAEGAAVRLTGFGEQNPSLKQPPDGNLYALSMTVGYSRTCGYEANALFVCASSPSGDACHGDSGGGLTSQTSPAVLLGVIDFGLVAAGEHCPPGAVNGFANLAAPEVHSFLEGSESPRRAPRGGGAVIRGVPSVGRSLTCEPGTWSNAPSFTYAFVDSSSGQALQRGSSSGYLPTARDIGRRILCEVQAANAGGTGVGRTPPLGPIAGTGALAPPSAAPALPAPVPQRAVEASISLLATSITVRHGGTARVRLQCRGQATCRGRLALTATRRVRIDGRMTLRNERIGVASFVVAAGRTDLVNVRLNAAGRGLLRAAHGRLRARLAITRLRAAPLAPQTQTVGVRLVQLRSR